MQYGNDSLYSGLEQKHEPMEVIVSYSTFGPIRSSKNPFSLSTKFILTITSKTVLTMLADQ